MTVLQPPVGRLSRFVIRPASWATGVALFGGGLVGVLVALAFLVESEVYASSKLDSLWWLALVLLLVIGLLVALALGAGMEAVRALRWSEPSAAFRCEAVGLFFLVGAVGVIASLIALFAVLFLSAG